jgi:putative ABC transport system substrate-binding protein
MKRRDFIALLGGAAAAWPLAARAQRSTSVIGVLSGSSLVGLENRMANFRRGLAETGYVEGRNLTIESRWAEEQYDRLPTLAKELVDRRVDVIFAVGAVRSVLAAKAATSAIPIVFELGSDPLEFGLVQSLNRPGGNVTGVSTFGRELLAKRTEVLRELISKNGAIGLLVNPQNPNTRPSLSEMQTLANAGGWPLLVGEVNIASDLGRAFAKLAEQRARGVVVCWACSVAWR